MLVFLGGNSLYAIAVPPNARLAEIGLIAFVAMAQFAPALFFALRDRPRDATAAKAGLATGLLLWGAILLLAGLGVFGPVDLAGGVLISLGGNVLAFALASAGRLRPVSPDLLAGEATARLVSIGALVDMAARFVGPAEVAEARGAAQNRAAPVNRRTAQTIERLIAGVVGAPSAPDHGVGAVGHITQGG